MSDYQIVLRHDTPSNWQTLNPVLATGEPGVEIGTGKMKVGNDVSHWNDLPYIGSGNGIQRTVFNTPFSPNITPNLPSFGGDVVYKIGTLTSSTTISNPTGVPLDEQVMQFTFTQDNTGNHQVTWGSAFLFGSDVTTALIPTGANAKWRMLFIYDAQVSKWKAVAIARGF